MNRITVPAGEYFIGDPCCGVFDGSWWAEALEACDYFELPLVVAGRTAFAFPTKAGEGVFYDNFGREYPVDSGRIGLVPVEMADGVPMPEGMHQVVFDAPTECFDDGGTLHFGDVVIPTGDKPPAPPAPPATGMPQVAFNGTGYVLEYDGIRQVESNLPKRRGKGSRGSQKK